jgi:RNA ligase
MDEELNIVSRPFRRFLDYDDINPADLPNEPFTVTEKMDGSLGISYWYDGSWNIATRGSFDNRHAVRANQILHQKYASCFKKMKPEYTYLFEIIYPENRIVVNYGDREELILLAIINTDTGEEITDFEDLAFSRLKTFDGITSIDDVLKLNDDHSEGVVVRFASGTRLKVKFDRYKRQHRIMLSLSETKVWRYLATGRNLENLYRDVGEEYHAWIKATKDKIIAAYHALKEEVLEEYSALPPFNSHEEAIDYVSDKEHADILLGLLNDEPIALMLWEHVKPDENASWFAERG